MSRRGPPVRGAAPRTVSGRGPAEPLRFGLSVAAFSAFMLAYEWGKQPLWPSIPIWSSHFITIAFSTLLAGTGGYLYLLKDRRLRESEGSFDFAVDGIGAGLWEWNLETGALRSSPHLSAMLGLEAGESLESMDALVALMHPEDRESILRSARVCLEDRERFYAELRLRRGDGTWKWISMSGRSVALAEGGRPCRASGFCLDIDERKRAEREIAKQLAEKETLLKEVHHRVKNNLQVISSIISLQESSLRDEADKELSRENQARVRSMAYLHELLYGSKGYSSVDPAKYLELIARGLSLSHGRYLIRVRAQSDSLSIDEAMPFGLIVNELITNALKYAYPEDVPAGAGEEGPALGREILVSYHRTDGERRLEVRDEGLGLHRDPDPEANASMGFPLVRGLAEQLGGRVFLEEARPGRPRPGLKATLVIPVPREGRS